MKANNTKTLFTLISAALLCAAAFLSNPANQAALAFEKKTGQDVAGKNCERVDTPESSTFGKCENVCKDKEVTRDAVNNRWVCKAGKTANVRPRGERAPISDQVLEPTRNPNPKRPDTAAPKTGKRKKN